MGEYYFHLDQLTVGYNGKPLIDQIQVGIHKGEIVTLIGPNGSGKSTILRAINKLIPISDGKIVLDLQGTEREAMTVEKLIEKFEINNDRMLL